MGEFSDRDPHPPVADDWLGEDPLAAAEAGPQLWPDEAQLTRSDPSSPSDPGDGADDEPAAEPEPTGPSRPSATTAAISRARRLRSRLARPGVARARPDQRRRRLLAG